MRPTTRLGEIAFGCATALLPLVEVRGIGTTATSFAIVLSSVGILAVIAGAAGLWGPARGVAACVMIGNGLVFAGSALDSNIVLWLDTAAFLLFLWCGGLAEAGVSELSKPVVDVYGFRLLAGGLALAGLVALQQLHTSGGAWLVFAAMAAGAGALSLASRNSATSHGVFRSFHSTRDDADVVGGRR